MTRAVKNEKPTMSRLKWNTVIVWDEIKYDWEKKLLLSMKKYETLVVFDEIQK